MLLDKQIFMSLFLHSVGVTMKKYNVCVVFSIVPNMLQAFINISSYDQWVNWQSLRGKLLYSFFSKSDCIFLFLVSSLHFILPSRILLVYSHLACTVIFCFSNYAFRTRQPKITTFSPSAWLTGILNVVLHQWKRKGDGTVELGMEFGPQSIHGKRCFQVTNSIKF